MNLLWVLSYNIVIFSYLSSIDKDSVSEKSMQTDGATTPSAPAECTLLQLPVARSIMDKQVVIPAAIVIGSVLQYQKKNPASGIFFYLFFNCVHLHTQSVRWPFLHTVNV